MAHRISDYTFDLMGVLIGLDWRDQVINSLQTNPDLLERMKSAGGDRIEDTIQRGLPHIKLQKRADPRFDKHNRDHKRLRSLVINTAKYGIRDGYFSIPLEDDIEDVFRGLKDRERDVHIYTSADTEFTEIVLGDAWRYVSRCFSSSERPELKDKYVPATYQKIAIQLGKNPQQLGYTSDDHKEAKASAQAGLGSVWHLRRDLSQPEQSADGYLVVPNLGVILEND